MNKKLAFGKSHNKVFIFSLFNLCLSGSAFYPALREEKFPSGSRCDFVLYHISIKQEWEELGVTVSNHEKKLAIKNFVPRIVFSISLSLLASNQTTPSSFRGGSGALQTVTRQKEVLHNSPFGSRFFNYNCLYRLRKRACTAFIKSSVFDKSHLGGYFTTNCRYTWVRTYFCLL